jgi:hypothetical protein
MAPKAAKSDRREEIVDRHTAGGCRAVRRLDSLPRSAEDKQEAGMAEQQGDLFAGGFRVERGGARHAPARAMTWDSLADEDLVAALDEAGLADCLAIAAELARRKPANATAALESLCRRFAGFGLEHAVPEQEAALDALLAIGDRRAAETVARLIARGVVQGPALARALAAAAALGCALPPAVLLPLLRNDDPRIRADACRCVHGSPAPEIVGTLFELLGDLNHAVSDAAGCALGRARRRDALDFLIARLRERPSAELIDAVAPIADEECIVLLGRIGAERESLRPIVLEAMDATDHPQAEKLAARLRHEARTA